MDKELQIIGSIEKVSIGKRVIDIPAKIDTGADSSSIWASYIRVDKDGILRFRLFDEGSRYYTGKVYRRKDYKVAMVKSSTGHKQIRYRTHFTVSLAGRKIKVLFNLSDRSKNTYKVLIGRRTIAGKFVVDVKKNAEKSPKLISRKLTKELQSDPYVFHKKYVANQNNNQHESGRIKKEVKK